MIRHTSAHTSTTTTGRRRRTATVIAAAAATALLAPLALAPPSAGAAPVERSGTDRTGAERPRASAVVNGDDPIDYVALGDSYSAGPLVPALQLGDLGCIRSTNNYPAFLADYFDVASFTDVTCSGAETDDLDRQRQSTIIPGPAPARQVGALSRATDLVTVGIGGNDYSLFGSMIDVCGEVAKARPNGAPCKAHFTNRKGVDTKLRDAKRIQRDVARSLRAVRRNAPNAEVYVVGYPRLLPERGSCDAVGFAKGDYAWGNRVERRLNLSLRNAAKATGARYVDLYPASRGHDACAKQEAWINGKTLNPLRAANFHPYLRGMRGAAQAIYHQLTGGRTAPAGVFAWPPIGGQPTVRMTPDRARTITDAWARWEESQGS
ncbi:SGNH/GDSL hydrolase family protein [Nocardioides sambongensis]|uniref:SGNH/GDSL hydrolase family protein n=1 Tax=Nocardioides sambongensis TaxID=2589074 RepID=UPI00112AD898|nr:SGNH/GDSL hydrolase family protein [Nocardioides sambongensis]